MALAALRCPAPVSAIRNSKVLSWPFNGSFPLYKKHAQLQKQEQGIKEVSLIPVIYTRMGAIYQALLFRQVEALAETLHAAGGVQDTLLPRIERMALRADINLQNRLNAFSFKAIATSTDECGLNIIWMYSLFHDLSQVPFYIHRRAFQRWYQV